MGKNQNIESLQGAEPFYLEGTNGKAVLLIHGYTGTPSQMRMLGEYLNGEGYTVCAPLLPGHGTNVEDLRKTRVKDWYKCVVDVYDELHKTFFDIAVIGLSMGGLLAIRLAAEKKVWKLVSVATPIYLYDKRLKWLWLLKNFMDYVKKKPHIYPVDDKYNVAYDELPVAPVSSMLKLIKKCRKKFLRRVHCPALVLQGGKDFTVMPKSAEFILEKIFSKDKQLLCLEDSGHVVLLDKQRNFVMSQIKEFLER
ncbi:MAG: alpha/beta fold hydrolase [Phascolarctobacterium sp.]|nr:alpha/beta fold hydrolase [Candidatus Phascolarctobacterium caballi]